MKMKLFLGYMLSSVAVATGLSLLCSLPVMWLWNACLVGAVNGVQELGWLQAWGIMLLCGLLFNTYVSTKAT